MKLSVTLFAMLAAAALVIAACGGDDADESAQLGASELTLEDRAYLGELRTWSTRRAWGFGCPRR